MSIFRDLFGKKRNPTEATPTASEPTLDPAKDPNMVRVFDGYGRELFIAKEQWRRDVLPGAIRKVWDQPDELYNIIVTTLNDGFRSNVIEAGRHLYRIDPDRSRGTCLWGVLLMEEDRLDEAENIFRGYLANHGENGLILSNLAKVYSRRKEGAKAEELLWHALEIDPNQLNGIQWYQAIHRERSGESGGQEALRRIAALPKSWRAQLWLARDALQSNRLEQALTYYSESLARAARPLPSDVLMQISGDLGNAGHLPELLQLTAPHFNPSIHGITVGNNLIKAYVDLGQIEAARGVVNQLYAVKRPDWQKTLSYWDTEIAKAQLDPLPQTEAASLQIAMGIIEGAVWLPAKSPATELFPAKSQAGPLIWFLGSSAEQATNSKRIEQQLSDTPGRLSRALPLFLSEQLEFFTTARTRTLVPSITGNRAGFVLSGVEWTDEDAANYSRQGELPGDYVVIVHLRMQVDPCLAELRLVRAIDAQCVAQLRTEFATTKPEASFPDLTSRLLASITSETDAQRVEPPEFYNPPGGSQLSWYLLRLEQLLATRYAAMGNIASGFLSGERDIIDGQIQLCVACPESIPARTILAQTLTTMKRIRPEIMSEYREKLALLKKEKALKEPANGVLQRMIDAAVEQ
jgi:tetratricopeptide (TPR) repeat protein